MKCSRDQCISSSFSFQVKDHLNEETAAFHCCFRNVSDLKMYIYFRCAT